MKYTPIKPTAETPVKPSAVKATTIKPKGTAHLKPPGEIRIIGGQYRRTKLPVPDKPGLRPTPDRVRETLFNWLGQNLGGWRVLDAFAGSGARLQRQVLYWAYYTHPIKDQTLAKSYHSNLINIVRCFRI